MRFDKQYKISHGIPESDVIQGKSRLVLDGYDYLTEADGELTDTWKIFGICESITMDGGAIPSACGLPP